MSNIQKYRDRKEMGVQYERCIERQNLCRKTFGTYVDIDVYGNFDYIQILADDGYEFYWKYDKSSEYLIVCMLINPSSFLSVKATFQDILGTIQNSFGTTNCQDEIIVTTYDQEKVKDTSLKCLEGLKSVQFSLKLPKTIELDQLEQVVNCLKSFGESVKKKFSHRRYEVGCHSREYYLTYCGYALESVDAIHTKALESIDKNEFLQTSSETKNLESATNCFELSEDWYVRGFRDV